MKRRAFVAGAGAVLGGALVPRAAVAAEPADEAAVKQAVEALYSVYFVEQDKTKYRSLLTDDYSRAQSCAAPARTGASRCCTRPG
jgi:hypothetical protein